MAPVSFGISYIVLALLLLVIPGTTLGWIAARNIRQSDGKLYGMRLAAFAALPLPMFIALFLLTFISLIPLRIVSAYHSDNGLPLLSVFIPCLVTGVILLIKIFATLLQSLKKGEPIIRGIISRLNKVTLITITLIWLIGGIVFAVSTIAKESPSIELTS